MNWDDPKERLRLLETVGTDEYAILMKKHIEKDVVSVVNGYGIRPVNSRYGLLYMVNGTNTAFATQAQAEGFARKLAGCGK